MVTGNVFEHVLNLDLEISSTLRALEEGIEFLTESNNENPDPSSVKLIELYEKAIQCLEELHHVATDYITK
jgi:hypothetical protein